MNDVFERLKKFGVVPTITASSVDDYLHICEALVEGGLPIAELCFRGTTPHEITLDAIEEVQKRGIVFVGCGTVLSKELAQEAVVRGAEFVASPVIDGVMLQWSRLGGALLIPGARTETDIHNAMKYGCTVIKVFLPRGGEIERFEHFSSLRGFFPEAQFVPTVNIVPKNIGIYLQAGAPFAATATSYILAGAVNEKRWDLIRNAACDYVNAVEAARK